MDVQIVEGDLLEQPTEAIVNAWDRNVIPWWLPLPQGVSGTIKRRAGLQPFREPGRLGPIPLGGAVATSAGRLPCRAVLHVAGIDLLWQAGVSIAARIVGLGKRSSADPLLSASSWLRSARPGRESPEQDSSGPSDSPRKLVVTSHIRPSMPSAGPSLSS